jgi:hypothetical protein
MDREQDAGWSNPRVLVIFAVIFLCGAMFGAAGMRAFLHSRITPFPDQRTIEAARAVPPGILAQKLNLTAQQQKAIMFQLDEYGKYYQNIEEERSDVARHGVEAIRQCLNDQQRKLFDQLVAKR